MAQPGVVEPNGSQSIEGAAAAADAHHQNQQNGKRKHDAIDGDEKDDDSKPASGASQRELVKACFDVMSSFDIDPPILKRPLAPTTTDENEPDAKRQKSAEPPSASQSIADKIAADAYPRLSDLITDIVAATKDALDAAAKPTQEAPSDNVDAKEDKPEVNGAKAADDGTKARIREFRTKALQLLRREEAYPQKPSARLPSTEEQRDDLEQSRAVLSLTGNAPQERRLFSSLPASQDIDWSQVNLPAGVSITHIVPSAPKNAQEKVLTLGDIFAPPRNQWPLQAPKQSKSNAKSNKLDFYQPELTAQSPYRAGSYFGSKLSAGHYLNYSHAKPTSNPQVRQHERQRSLAGEKPSTREQEISEMDTLFRGAFSSFAPCKDDSAAVVPSNVAGRMWWQRAGQQAFHDMIEIGYYDEDETNEADADGFDEKAVQDAIENWDDSVVDPTLEDAVGTKRNDGEKEADEILDEVSDMIETLASYQRIRSLNLPNSQNRPGSEPVTGDMLATPGPEPSEEERATYQMLKDQLALIVKTLPPYVVAKLNGDQLDELLISTRIQLSDEQYHGVMEEDDAAVQARMRAMQQQQQQAAAAAAAAQQQHHHGRAPSMSYQNQYTPNAGQYGTPTRPSSRAQQQQQYYRKGMAATGYQQQPYQQPRGYAQQPQQRATPQPNQYSRPNGYGAQYATQLAKAQTPFGHQNMPQQYAAQHMQQQPRPQYGQMMQQATPNARYYPQQQPLQPQQFTPGTPTAPHYAGYPNGQQPLPQQQRVSPHVQARQLYSPSPNMQQAAHPQQQQQQQQQRYAAAGRYPPSVQPALQPQPQQQQQQVQTPGGSSGSLGYHTVIPESHQQRILEQAKARVAAQERPPSVGPPAGNLNAARAAAVAAASGQAPGQNSKPSTPTPGPTRTNSNGGTPIPMKVTPVPVPVMPGQQPRKPSAS